jgi:hypothetical protein
MSSTAYRKYRRTSSTAADCLLGGPRWRGVRRLHGAGRVLLASNGLGCRVLKPVGDHGTGGDRRDPPAGRDLGSGAVVKVLLDKPRIFVTYGSASVVTGEDEDWFYLDEPWSDETNVLCGASVPGVLVLQIGMRTGWGGAATESG